MRPADLPSLTSRAWRHYRREGLRSLITRLRLALRNGTWALEPAPTRLPDGVVITDPRGIIAVLDAPPRDGIQLSDAVVVSGWACSQDEVDRIDLYLDGDLVGQARPGIMRPDVAHRLPRIPQAARSGFSTSVRLDDRSIGVHDLVVAVRDRAGRCRAFGRTFERIDPGEAYDVYYRATLPSRAEAARLQQRAAAHPGMQLWVEGDADGDLAGTLRSITDQDHQKWHCTIISGRERVEVVRRAVDASVPADRRGLFSVQPRPAFTDAGPGGRDWHQGFLRPGERLAPDALVRYAVSLLETKADVLYSDHDYVDGNGRHVEPWFVPDWSPDHLLSRDYVGGFYLSRRLVPLADGTREVFPLGRLAWRFELLLAVTEHATRVGHVPEVLWSAPTKARDTRNAAQSEQLAVRTAIKRRGLSADIADGAAPGIRRVTWPVVGDPKVSIIIPTTGNLDLLRPCVESIMDKTAYPAYEFVFIDNSRGKHPDGSDYIRALGHTVLERNEPFNWAKLNNHGARAASGQLFLFLNDDVEVVRDDWLTELVSQAMRPGIGAVGGLLLYPDGSIQHAGVLLVDHGGGAMHYFQRVDPRRGVYLDLDHVTREVSGNTGACLMVHRSRFEEVGGFDERFVVAGNDVDFCLRLIERGYRNIWTPYSRLIHHEGVSRAALRVDLDEFAMRRRWRHLLRDGDPYSNPNFAPDRSDCSFALSSAQLGRFRGTHGEPRPESVIESNV